jgi:hypothetical protein
MILQQMTLFSLLGLVNLTFDNQTEIEGDSLWDLEAFSSKIFIHFWLGCIFIFTLWPPSMFKASPRWSSKKSAMSKRCYTVSQSIEETPGWYGNLLVIY